MSCKYRALRSQINNHLPDRLHMEIESIYIFWQIGRANRLGACSVRFDADILHCSECRLVLTILIETQVCLHSIQRIVCDCYGDVTIIFIDIPHRHFVPSLLIDFEVSTPNILDSICTSLWHRQYGIRLYDDIACCFDTHIAVEITWKTCFNLIKQSTNLIHWDSILSFYYDLLDFISWNVFFTFLEQGHSTSCIWKELIVVLEDSLSLHIRNISIQFINELNSLINAQFLLCFIFEKFFCLLKTGLNFCF